MQSRNIKIVGMGKYLPERVVTSEEIDKKINVREGWTEKKSGVKTRHYVLGETASYMASQAILEALKDANLTVDDIDCLVCGSGTYEQAIPCTASLIQAQLGWQDSKIPCFDINSTCLSFVTSLEIMSYMVQAGKYKNVIIVSSEIASVGLNWEQTESCVLFGDGAAAFIISRNEESSSKIIASNMETYSEGVHMTEIRGGGTKVHPRVHSELTKNDFLFDMDGKGVFRLASKHINGFVDNLLESANMTMNDIDMVIPHQASGMAMRILMSKLGVKEDRFMNILEDHGNTIAASIPMTLYEAIKQEKVKRGDKVMLLGTSAGLSIGGVILEY